MKRGEGQLPGQALTRCAVAQYRTVSTLSAARCSMNFVFLSKTVSGAARATSSVVSVAIYRLASYSWLILFELSKPPDTELMWLLFFLLLPVSKQVIQLDDTPMMASVSEWEGTKEFNFSGHVDKFMNAYGSEEWSNFFVICTANDNDCSVSWEGFTFNDGTIKASSHETHMKINSWSDREILAAHNNFESMTIQLGELVNVTDGSRRYRLKAFANFFFSKDRQFQREILPGLWVIK